MAQNGQGEHPEPVPVTCRDCRHYYVTWDKGFPHGCRVMGFKSRTSPALSVRQASRMDCQLFVKRGLKEE